MEIDILEREENDQRWVLVVVVSEMKFRVIVDKDYWAKLTKEQMNIDKLIEKSFQFLLEKESKESILPEFNLREIEKYFPEYQDFIKSF